ncbi:hypothetical protein PN462_13945 [Spirulina sp. CS-785/01]|uniref:beta-carboxysome assembly chaperone CcmS n=1 Tax=Spirulina sp. CS-785/01 TaxID=3021716 RepID=UPI002330A0F6|nr:hypothetical protein [Spirulina sp. CS-785/01]MDB9314210.1 hypothetical protein [Spirulina sp. CS-785/01]
MFSSPRPPQQKDYWKVRLDQFTREAEKPLAALAWGFLQEQKEQKTSEKDPIDTLAIDLSPTPHLVSCSRESLETLNRNVNYRLQEILGLIDNYKPDEEVLMLAIGPGEIKLLYFKPETPPPDSFAELGQTLDDLIPQIESQLLSLFPEASDSSDSSNSAL